MAAEVFGAAAVQPDQLTKAGQKQTGTGNCQPVLCRDYIEDHHENS